jgi:hypothetical protein
MTTFRNTYPIETSELDAAVEAAGCRKCCHLRGLRIFVDQAAEPVFAQNAHTRRFDGRMRASGGRLLLQ